MRACFLLRARHALALPTYRNAITSDQGSKGRIPWPGVQGAAARRVGDCGLSSKSSGGAAPNPRRLLRRRLLREFGVIDRVYAVEGFGEATPPRNLALGRLARGFAASQPPKSGFLEGRSPSKPPENRRPRKSCY